MKFEARHSLEDIFEARPTFEARPKFYWGQANGARPGFIVCPGYCSFFPFHVFANQHQATKTGYHYKKVILLILRMNNWKKKNNRKRNVRVNVYVKSESIIIYFHFNVYIYIDFFGSSSKMTSQCHLSFARFSIALIFGLSTF